MRDPRNEGGGQVLDLSQNFFDDDARAAAYGRLVADVFDFAPSRPLVPDPVWQVLAYFEPDGTCVAGVEIGELTLVLDGVDSASTAIRLAGVAPSHRGQGLFRSLMDAALGMCDARDGSAPTLLYTEDDDLYARFGFVRLAQHAFVGAAPKAARLPPARSVDRSDALVLIDRLASGRAPISLHCAVCCAADLLRSNLDDEDLRFAVLDGMETLLLYEMDEDDLVIVDIVARTIPTMAEIVGALAPGKRRVRTLFSPDRLSWDGTPEREDTGLMIRGELPAAMRRPFMLPPTTSF